MPSSARTSWPLGGRQRRHAVGDEQGAIRIDALDLDHAPLIRARDGDEDIRAARHELAIEQAPQRLALVGPAVLVGEDDRHARHAAHERPPHVRAELVRVQDLHALAPEKALERPPGPDVELAPTSQRKEAHAGVGQLLERLRGRRVGVRDIGAALTHRVEEKRSGSSRVAINSARRSAPPWRLRPSMRVTTRIGNAEVFGDAGLFTGAGHPIRASSYLPATLAGRMAESASQRTAPQDGSAGFFSSASTLPLPVGVHFDTDAVHGYYIDLRAKAATPVWPAAEHRLYVTAIQWGLACYERYIAGEGEAWLAAARDRAEELLAIQQPDGTQAGGFVHTHQYKHTFMLKPPWISAISQGEGASLLVRIFNETGEERYAEAARRALLPLSVDSLDGGVRAMLGGRAFPEEYPTRPPSFVLNGAIFTMWGMHDVGVALDDCARASRPSSRPSTRSPRTCIAGTSATGRAMTCSHTQCPTSPVPSITTFTSTSCVRCTASRRGRRSPTQPTAGR